MEKKRSPIQGATPVVGADNFQNISGIGPAVENRLYEAGILTYGQLAAMSPEQIATLVAKIAGLSAERIAKQNWIGQAHDLMAIEMPVETDTSVVRQHYATFKVDLLLSEGGDVRRTRAAHIQGGHEEIWAGWEERRLIDFFVEQADLQRASPVPATSQSVMPDQSDALESNQSLPLQLHGDEPVMTALPQLTAILPTERMTTPLTIHVDALSVEQVPAEPHVNPPLNPPRLRAQMNFRLSGSIVGPLTTGQSSYTLHILACELPSGKTTLLAAEHQQLRPDQLDYSTMLDFTLPEPGRYQLQGLVLLPDMKKAGTMLGPIVRVLAE